MNNDAYETIGLGDIHSFSRKKQEKLKEQELQVVLQASQELLPLFTGLSIHINGYTPTPKHELRRMILGHGGDYQQYLKRASVTHIIATTLASAKMHTLRHYKVVTSEWITDSIKAQRLLPWKDYSLYTKYTSCITPQDGDSIPITESISPHSSSMEVSLSEEDPEEERVSIQCYDTTSKIHHPSSWKEEMKKTIQEWHKKKNSILLSPHKKRKRRDTLHVIMHVEFDVFFASVGLLDRPHLKNRPVVVVMDGKEKVKKYTSSVVSCNYIARNYGIQNDMSMEEAKKKCLELHVIPYEHEKYKSVSEAFYKIMFSLADGIEAVSMDEVFLEVSSHITQPGTHQEEDLAIYIRTLVREETRCDVSIGIGQNRLLARLATRMAKPNGHYHCLPNTIKEVLHLAPVADLPGLDPAVKKKLETINVQWVDELAAIPFNTLQLTFGEAAGKALYNYSRGIDDSLLSKHQEQQPWGICFEDSSSRLPERANFFDCDPSHYSKKHTLSLKNKLKACEDSTAPSKSHAIPQEKPVMNVDREVYSELPLSVQQELSDRHTIAFIQAENTTSNAMSAPNKEKPPSSSISETETYLLSQSCPSLPPWPQIDMEALFSLSLKMQQQILREYQSNPMSSSSHTVPIQKVPLTLAYSSSSGKLSKSKTTASYIPKHGATLTQMFSKDHTTTEETALTEHISLDMSVVNELPADLREEILAEERERKAKYHRVYPAMEEQTGVSTLEKTFENTALNWLSVHLSVTTDIQSIRTLLRHWVMAYPKGPEIEDAMAVNDFVLKLAHYKDFDKARLVVLYLDHLSNATTQGIDTYTWYKETDSLRCVLIDYVKKRYHCQLRF
ncbi:hypothetical protein BDF14DRAFT_1993276 [Spinellus fusiger]|nr:hypothetical protein BDF14DRAFT_1993276 [Spinellus fusiger]